MNLWMWLEWLVHICPWMYIVNSEDKSDCANSAFWLQKKSEWTPWKPAEAARERQSLVACPSLWGGQAKSLYCHNQPNYPWWKPWHTNKNSIIVLFAIMTIFTPKSMKKSLFLRVGGVQNKVFVNNFMLRSFVWKCSEIFPKRLGLYHVGPKNPANFAKFLLNFPYDSLQKNNKFTDELLCNSLNRPSFLEDFGVSNPLLFFQKVTLRAYHAGLQIQIWPNWSICDLELGEVTVADFNFRT